MPILLCNWYHTFFLCSFQFVEQSLRFDSNKQFCEYCSVLLSYLSSFAPTATNFCPISSATNSKPFCFTKNFYSSFDMTPSFQNSLRLILFNCPNSLRNTLCFSKIFLRQFCCQFPVVSFLL